MKNNIFKKLIASALCLSFMTLQTTFAESVIPVLPDNGSGGAQINGSHGGFTGVEKPDSNNANLNFNGDAVLDWGFLNVGKNQSLNFINGNWAVLNNVLNGMSTIAGSITGGQGAIIISNPNGMLMAPGGSISTAGTLVLTTQDLTNKYTFNDGKLNINYDYLNNPNFSDGIYNVIALNGGKISGGNINLIAKGIDLKDADLTSSGNISFTTKDGANFIQAAANVSKTNGIKFDNNSSIQIANSSLRSSDPDGLIDLVTDKASNVVTTGSSFTAKDTNVTAHNIYFNRGLTAPTTTVATNTFVSGNLTTNANGANGIVNTNVKGKATINAEAYNSIDKLTTKELDTSAGYFTNLTNSTITGNAKARVGKTTSTSRPDQRMFFMKDTKVGGNLDASSETGYIHLDGGSVGGDATLAGNTRGDGNMGHIIIGYKGNDKEVILSDKTAAQHSTSIGGVIKATAKRGHRSDRPELAKGDILAYSDGNLVFKGGSAEDNLIADSGKNILINRTSSGYTNTNTTVGNDLILNAKGSNAIIDVQVGNKSVINSAEGYNSIDKLTTKELDTSAGYFTNLTNSTITGNAKARVGKTTSTSRPDQRMFFMKDTKVGGNLDASSETGYIHLDGGSVGGDATLAGNTRGDGNMGHIIIGYKGNDKEVILSDKTAAQHSTSIGGVIKATANKGHRSDRPELAKGDILAYSDGNLTFEDSLADNNITAESKNGNVSFTNSVAGSADLTAGKDATIDNSKVAGNTNIKTVDGNATVKNNSKVGKLTMNSTNADVNVIDSTVNGTATLTAGHDVNSTFSKYTDKLDATAGHDVNYKTTGDINLDNSTNMSLKAGNKTELTTIDGNITVDNLPTGTDVVKGKEVSLVADGNITFTGDNVIDGDLRVKSTGGNGFVAINGDSTKADNIYVDKAHWVEIKNVDTDHLQMENFDIGHLIQSRIGSAGFNNGDTLYINILNTVLNGQLVKNLDPAFEINRGTTLADIIYYPLTNGGAGGGEEWSTDDAARLLGYMREKGIDGLVGKDFAPIAFAAYDRGKRGAIFRAAGESIYKDVSQVVHITDRFNLDD